MDLETKRVYSPLSFLRGKHATLSAACAATIRDAANAFASGLANSAP